MGTTGRYGFLTDYSSMSESEARSRIQLLYYVFGIREFQFYDWASSYSLATAGERWNDPFTLRAEVSKSTLRYYIDEIRRLGGRSWAYVQAVGSEEADLDKLIPGVFPLKNGAGINYVHANRFPCYFANEPWARYQVFRWAPEIKKLGFTGIHWDTLGKLAGDPAAEQTGMHEFIKTAASLLKGYGLLQTFNFVSLAWWDADIIKNNLAFTYAEVWNGDEEKKYYDFMLQNNMNAPENSGVIAYYPSKDVPSEWCEEAVMVARWIEAEKNNLTYLLVGDGSKRLHNEYFPNNRLLLSKEVEALRTKVLNVQEICRR